MNTKWGDYTQYYSNSPITKTVFPYQYLISYITKKYRVQATEIWWQYKFVSAITLHKKYWRTFFDQDSHALEKLRVFPLDRAFVTKGTDGCKKNACRINNMLYSTRCYNNTL